MAFLDMIKDAAKTAADKTGELIEVQKLSGKINANNNRIVEIKQKIGEYYWTQYAQGASLPDEAKLLCAEIKTLLDAIEDLNADIAAIRAKEDVAPATEPPRQDPEEAATLSVEKAPPTQCPACGATLPAGECRFCPSCGQKI